MAVSARALLLPLLGLALGLLGLLPGAAGALERRAFLGWLFLAAPALGAWLAGCGLGPRFLAALPLAWLACGALATGGFSPWAGCVVVGLFGAGVALGRWRGARASVAALAVTLALAGAPLGFGWLSGGAELARLGAPGFAALLLDASPLVLGFDCAGLDWLHAQPEVYARAGVEWFPRRPWSGNLAGPAVLVVGCLLAFLVPGPRTSVRDVT